MIPFGEALGYIAAVLTTVAFVPQTLHTIKSQNTQSISLGMYITFVIGIMCWLGYGIYRQDMAIIVSNIITGSLASCILYCKLRNEFFR